MFDESARLKLAGGRFADVRWHQEVDSTNRVAADLLRAGWAGGAVGADHQTAGRGRLGRIWEAPPGSSLLVSAAWRPAPPGQVQLSTIAMALAAAAACAEVAGVEPFLKWPNDLVVDDRKLGGILGGVVRDAPHLGGVVRDAPHVGGVVRDAPQLAVVVGLGLNVNWDGPVPASGVALNQLVGGPVDRAELLVALLGRLDGLCDADDDLLREYRARSATLGREVRVDLAAGTAVDGEAVAITDDGHLVVEEADGRRRVVVAGDVVHVR